MPDTSSNGWAKVFLTTLFVVIGDALLQVSSVGKLPNGSAEWLQLARPEVINALAVLLVVGGALTMGWRSSAATVAAMAVATLVAAGAHRVLAGASLTMPNLAVIAAILFLLIVVSFWVAGTLLDQRSSEDA